jgi:hypothetical protein
MGPGFNLRVNSVARRKIPYRCETGNCQRENGDLNYQEQGNLVAEQTGRAASRHLLTTRGLI